MMVLQVALIVTSKIKHNIVMFYAFISINIFTLILASMVSHRLIGGYMPIYLLNIESAVGITYVIFSFVLSILNFRELALIITDPIAQIIVNAVIFALVIHLNSKNNENNNNVNYS